MPRIASAGLAGVEREQDGDQAADDMRIAVAEKAEAGDRSSCSTLVASHTWLTQPWTLLAAVLALSGKG